MRIHIVLLILMDSVVNAALRMKRQFHARPSQFPMPYERTPYNYYSGYQPPWNYRVNCGYCTTFSYSRQPEFNENPNYYQYNIPYSYSYQNIQPTTVVIPYGWSYGNPHRRPSRPTGYGRPQNIPYSLPRENKDSPKYSIRPEMDYEPQVNENEDYEAQTHENPPIDNTVPNLPKDKTQLLENIVTTPQPVAPLPETSDEEAVKLGEQIEKSMDKSQIEVTATNIDPLSHMISARAQSTNLQVKSSEKKIPPSMVLDGESISDQDNSKVLDDDFALTRTMSPEVHAPDETQLNKGEVSGHVSPPFWPPRDDDILGPPERPARAHASTSHHTGPPGL